MEFVPIAAMALLSLKIVDFLRYLRAGSTNGVITQLAAWIGGVLVAVLAAQTNWASGIQVGDMNLAALNIWSLIFWGMAAGSTASFVKDTTKAIDNANSAALPTLLRGRYRPVTPNDQEVG